MAVFTQVAAPALASWLADNYQLELGGSPEPIAAGIENTNYYIACANGDAYVFTIIEVWPKDIAVNCLNLALHMHNKGLTVPRTLLNAGGATCSSFDGKPAAVVKFVNGAPRLQPSTAECAIMGATIAALHDATADYPGQIRNQRGVAWRRISAAQIAPHLDLAARELLTRALAVDERVAAASLTESACHCDLFRSNVLWENERISGIIDFYFAGCDLPAFDLAVACIDWCMDDTGAIYTDQLAAMLGAYQRARTLQPDEPAMIADIFVCAALRFWLSRLLDLQQPRVANLLQPHDPQAFQARLVACLDQPDKLLQGLR